MAVPGTAYATNWNGYIGQWPILIIVPLVVMFYLPFYRRLNITTAYEYLEKRFNVATRVIGSVTFMLFHVGRIAIVLYLPALALSSVTNIDIFAAIAVIGVLCVIYTVMGGIEAVVWTDAIQAIVLIGGALLCFGLVVSQVDGGLGAVGSAMSEQGKGITASWDFSDISIGKGSTSGFVFVRGVHVGEFAIVYLGAGCGAALCHHLVGEGGGQVSLDEYRNGPDRISDLLWTGNGLVCLLSKQARVDGSDTAGEG